MVKRPAVYEYFNYEELEKVFTRTSCFKMGVVIYNKVTGDRCKIRNRNFETARNIEWHKEKLKYQYKSLLQDGRVHEFLDEFPEHQELFNEFSLDITKCSNGLFRNYLNCYVNKTANPNDFQDDIKKHLFALHKIYKTELRSRNEYITPKIVNEYVSYC